MALSTQDLQSRLQSGELTLGEALEFAKANTTATNEKGQKSSSHSAIDALYNSFESGEDPTGLTLDSKWSELNDDEVLRNLGGATESTETNRLRNLQVVENTLRAPIRNAGVSDQYPLLVGGKDTDSRTKELGLKVQKRNKKPTQALVPSEEVDRIYFGTKENPGGALANVKDPNVRGFLIYQRYTGARIESTIGSDGLKVGEISFRKDKDGNRVATIKSKTSGKKSRPAAEFTGPFAEFLYSENQRAKASGQTNLFQTTKSAVDSAWNNNFRPIFESEFSDALPIDPKTKQPAAPPAYPRKMVATILEEEVGAPKDLVSDWMGHVDSSTRAQSYTGGRGSKIEVGRLVDGMVRDSSRMFGTDNTNVFFVSQGVDLVDPLKDYPSADTSYGFSLNPFEMPAPSYERTELSVEELEAQKRAFISEANARTSKATTAKLQSDLANLQAELEIAKTMTTPENAELLRKKAEIERQLKAIKSGKVEQPVEEVEAFAFSDESKGKAKNMMGYLRKFAASKTGKVLGAFPALGTPLSALDLPRRKEVLMSTGEYTEQEVDKYLAQEFAKEEFTIQGMVQGAGLGIQALFGEAPTPEEQDQQEIDRMRSQMKALGISNIEYY